MAVSKDKVLAAWNEFLRGGIEAYQHAAREFQEKQPELWRMLRQLDDEWFSGKTDHVSAYGVFIWRVMRREYGTIGNVSGEALGELMREELEFAERLEEESEFVANQLLDERLGTFPEPALAAHIRREFAEGSAGAKELNPRNNEMAVRWLMVGLRGLAKSALH